MAQKHDILYVNFYTDGSAAKKIAPAFPVAAPRKKASVKRQKKVTLYVDPVAFCSLIVAAVLLVMMAVGLTHLQNARAEAQVMENYLDEVTAEKIRLQQEFDTEVDLETVERTALAMGMVPKDQVKTVDIQVEPIHLEDTKPEESGTFFDQVFAVLASLF